MDELLELTPEDAAAWPYPCEQCHRRFKSPPALRMHRVRKHGKGWDTGHNFRKNKRLANLNRRGGKPWTDQQREKFRRTMRAKARRKLQYVFPVPPESNNAAEPAAEEPVAVITCFCPKCGENLSKWKREE
jgi:hypothetical protein